MVYNILKCFIFYSFFGFCWNVFDDGFGREVCVIIEVNFEFDFFWCYVFYCEWGFWLECWVCCEDMENVYGRNFNMLLKCVRVYFIYSIEFVEFCVKN